MNKFNMILKLEFVGKYFILLYINIYTGHYTQLSSSSTVFFYNPEGEEM